MTDLEYLAQHPFEIDTGRERVLMIECTHPECGGHPALIFHAPPELATKFPEEYGSPIRQSFETVEIALTYIITLAVRILADGNGRHDGVAWSMLEQVSSYRNQMLAALRRSQLN